MIDIIMLNITVCPSAYSTLCNEIKSLIGTVQDGAVVNAEDVSPYGAVYIAGIFYNMNCSAVYSWP